MNKNTNFQKRILSLLLAFTLVFNLASPVFATNSNNSLGGDVSVSATATPEATVAPTATPETTVAPTIAPETTVAPTVAPETTVAPTVAPEVTVAPTVTPEVTVAPTATPEVNQNSRSLAAPKTASTKDTRFYIYVHNTTDKVTNLDDYILDFATGGKNSSYYVPSVGSELKVEMGYDIIDTLFAGITPDGVKGTVNSYFSTEGDGNEVENVFNSLIASNTLPETIAEYKTMYLASVGGTAQAGFTNSFVAQTQNQNQNTPIIWYVAKTEWNAVHINGLIIHAYEVNYDLNGGTLNGSTLNFKEDGLQCTDMAVTLPSEVPTKSGSLFAGWTINGDTSGKVYLPGESFTMLQEDTTLTVNWIEINDLVIDETIGLYTEVALETKEFSFTDNPAKENLNQVQNLVDTLTSKGYTVDTTNWTWTSTTQNIENGYTGGDMGPSYHHPTRVVNDGTLKVSPWQGTVLIPLEINGAATSITVDWSFNLTSKVYNVDYFESQEAFDNNEESTNFVDNNDYYSGENTAVVSGTPVAPIGYQFTHWFAKEETKSTVSLKDFEYLAEEALKMPASNVDLIAQYSLIPVTDYSISAESMTTTYSKQEVSYDESKITLDERLDKNTIVIEYFDENGSAVVGKPVDAGKYTVNIYVDHPSKDTQEKIITSTTLTILQKEVQIIVKDDTKIYGEEDTLNYEGVTIDGLISGDDLGLDIKVSRPSMTITNKYPLGQTDKVGTSELIATIESGVINKNYVLNDEKTIVNGEFTITEREISLKPVDAGKYYGENNPVFDVEVSVGSLANDDTIQDLFLEGTSPVVTFTGASEEVAKYINGLEINNYVEEGFEISFNKNYKISYEQGDFLIAPRPVLLIANDASKTVGESDPEFTYRVEFGENTYGYPLTGDVLIDSDDLGTITVGRPDSATQNEAGVKYIDALWVTNSNQTNTSYVVSYEKGDFTVNPVATIVVGPITPVTPVTPPVIPAEPVIPEVEIEEVDTPAVDAPEVGIDDMVAPLASFSASWALINLILTIITSLMSIVLLFKALRKNKEEIEEEDGTLKTINNKKLFKILSVIPMVATIALFILTQDITAPMQMIDEYTLITAIITGVQMIVMYFARKEETEEIEETV